MQFAAHWAHWVGPYMFAMQVQGCSSKLMICRQAWVIVLAFIVVFRVGAALAVKYINYDRR